MKGLFTVSGDGMSGFVTALTAAEGGLTSANLWSEASNCATLIAAIVIFAFGYNIVRKVTKGAAKGKVRL